MTQIVIKNQKEIERAGYLLAGILVSKHEVSKHLLLLGGYFKEMRDKKLYVHTGWSSPTWGAFLGEAGISSSAANNFIRIFEFYSLKHKIDPEFLASIGHRKLIEVMPAIKKEPDKVEDWLHKAHTNSTSDLINEVRALQGRDPMKSLQKTSDLDMRSYEKYVKSHACVLHPYRPMEHGHHFPRTKGAGAEDWKKIPLCSQCHFRAHHAPLDWLLENKDELFDYFYEIIKFKFRKEA